jgi:hypothetical protein
MRAVRGRCLLSLITAVLIPVGFVLPAQATQTAVKNFSSCDRLWNEYPNGVAGSKKAANTAVRNGFARPRVSASLYRTNSGRLDRDKDGVMCEQGGATRANDSAEIQFLWGFLRAKEVDAPKPGACRDVSLVFDVRNDQVLPLAIDIQLADDFANEYAFRRVMADTLKRGVNSGNALRICGNEWIGPHLTSDAIFSGVRSGDYYLVATELSLAGTSQRNTQIFFR